MQKILLVGGQEIQMKSKNKLKMKKGNYDM